MANEKGATYLDKLCHKLYDEPKPKGFDSKCICKYCGNKVVTYYCEEMLYLVRCEGCGNLVLTEANSPAQAAVKTIGRAE